MKWFCPSEMDAQSLGCHQNRKRYIDGLLVPADCVQSAAHVAGDLR
jgi:hypothetical protein